MKLPIILSGKCRLKTILAGFSVVIFTLSIAYVVNIWIGMSHLNEQSHIQYTFHKEKSHSKDLNHQGFIKNSKRKPALSTSFPINKMMVQENTNHPEDRESSTYDFPDTQLGRHFAQHMLIMEDLGPEAEPTYQHSLAELRRSPEESTALLVEAYYGMEEDGFLDRWKLVNTLSSLEDDVSLAALSSIAGEPIPEELYPGQHGVSSRSEEVMIRSAAIRGIENLANMGSHEARQELLKLVKSQDVSVREMAVLAYRNLSIDGQDQKEILYANLSDKDRWMLELEEIADVRTLQQPDPVKEIGTGEALTDDDTEKKVDSEWETNTSPPSLIK